MNEYNENELQNEFLSLLYSIVNEEIGLIEGCRLVTSFKHSYTNLAKEDLDIFEAVDSETDHYPIGAAREHWDSKALAKLDKEMREYEEEIKEEVTSACNIIIKNITPSS